MWHHFSGLHYSEEAPSVRSAAPDSGQVPLRRAAGSASLGSKAPRPQSYQLTDGCEEEPSLVNGHSPLLLIVVDSDLGREGVHWEGEKSRDHRSQAGKSAVTPLPDSPLRACQANSAQTHKPSPPGSIPGLVGCFSQILQQIGGSPLLRGHYGTDCLPMSPGAFCCLPALPYLPWYMTCSC